LSDSKIRQSQPSKRVSDEEKL
ncbi:unnamed protein product, partial [Allacma fusca]